MYGDELLLVRPQHPEIGGQLSGDGLDAGDLTETREITRRDGVHRREDIREPVVVVIGIDLGFQVFHGVTDAHIAENADADDQDRTDEGGTAFQREAQYVFRKLLQKKRSLAAATSAFPAMRSRQPSLK